MNTNKTELGSNQTQTQAQGPSFNDNTKEKNETKTVETETEFLERQTNETKVFIKEITDDYEMTIKFKDKMMFPNDL